MVEARNGEEAWQFLRLENGPQLAILDWEMPGLTGSEVCQLVRKADLPVYILMFTERTEANNLIEINESSSTATSSCLRVALIIGNPRGYVPGRGQRRCVLQNSIHRAT